MLSGKNLSYTIQNKNIVIRRVEDVKRVPVSGNVKDNNGELLPGVAIINNTTSEGTSTDIDGNFTIKARKGDNLVFMFLGYKDVQLALESTNSLNVVMNPDRNLLDDAVVIGYGTMKKSDLTGSVTSIKDKALESRPISSVDGLLQGKVAGLQVIQSSGEPGASAEIRLRGVSSRQGSNSPLYVVDGFPYGDAGALKQINVNDITSIEVLKDASAASIYGSRGANGVILITTKSGTANAGKTAITFDANFNVTTRARDLDMLSGEEWIRYRFERGDNDYWYFGKDTDGDGIEDTPKTPEDYGRPVVDWRDIMFRNAFSQQYNLSVRTSVGRGTNILASLGYLDQQGLIVNNGYTKLTAKVKVDHEINSKVKVGVNANYARTRSSGAATSSGGAFSGYGMTQMIYLEKPLERFEDPADANSSYTAFTSIYDCISEESSRTGISDKLMGNAYFNWNIIKDLTLRVYASGSMSSATNNEFYSAKTRWGRSNNGVAMSSSSNSYGVNANATLTYKHVWKKKHNFDAMVGGELSDYGYMSYSQEAVDFEEDALGDMSMAMGTIKNPVQVKNSNSRLSAFGRVNYNYDWRYYATLNFRADASSKFSKGHRVGYFPSLSAAWRISNEPWMKQAKSSGVDNLKLRLSAGLSGNDRISNYAYMSYMDKIYYAAGGNSQLLGTAEFTLGNEKLKWETTYQYDLGLDLTLFKGRVDLVFDAYYKDTRDMLFMATLPSQMGFTSQWQNIGRVSNKGIELSLNTVNVRKRDFSWNTSLTFSLNRNCVEDLGEGVSVKPNNVPKGAFKDEPTQLMVGQPIGIIYGYEWDGNYQLSDFDIYYRSTKIPVDAEFVNTTNYGDFDFVLKKE
jgi:TonB-linked SusC/RagA family outer membrane protein